MSIKDDYPLNENDLSPEEADVYERMKAERDKADCDVDDYEFSIISFIAMMTTTLIK